MKKSESENNCLSIGYSGRTHTFTPNVIMRKPHLLIIFMFEVKVSMHILNYSATVHKSTHAFAIKLEHCISHEIRCSLLTLVRSCTDVNIRHNMK